MSFPSEWETSTLQDCLSAIIDYRGKTPVKTSVGIPLITAKVVKDGRIETPNEFIAEEDYDTWMTRGLPQPSDVVITTEAPLGEVAQLGNERIALAQRIILLRGDRQRLDNTYLKYCLSADYVQSQLHGRASGTTVTGIKQSELRKIEIAIPPLAEQKNIAELLGSLDDKIELNRRMNATLEAMAQALFKSWFVDFDPVKAKAAGRAPEGMDADTAARFPSEFVESELGLIPKGWEALPLYETAKFINGAAFKSEDFCGSGEGLPVIKIAELKEGISDQTKWSQRKAAPDQLINTGDLLYSWSGSPDTSLDAFLWTTGVGLLNQHIFKVVAPTTAQKHFVYYLLRYLRPVLVEIARNKQTTGLGHVTVANMKRLLVCWPSKDILASFDWNVASIFDKAFANSMESQTLAKLRDILLPKLISGQLRIPEAEAMAEAAL